MHYKGLPLQKGENNSSFGSEMLGLRHGLGAKMSESFSWCQEVWNWQCYLGTLPQKQKNAQVEIGANESPWARRSNFRRIKLMLFSDLQPSHADWMARASPLFPNEDGSMPRESHQIWTLPRQPQTSATARSLAIKSQRTPSSGLFCASNASNT